MLAEIDEDGIYRIRVKVVHQKQEFTATIAQWETILVVQEINDAVSHEHIAR